MKNDDVTAAIAAIERWLRDGVAHPETAVDVANALDKTRGIWIIVEDCRYRIASPEGSLVVIEGVSDQ
jgi:uncharacterized protein YjhX (UPF0386 family)